MAVVISASVRTYKDVKGNPEVRGNFLIEFRDAAYFAGQGEIIDLSPYMQRVDYIMTTPALITSAARRALVYPNMALYPGLAGSGALQIYNAVSGLLEAQSGEAYSGLKAVITVYGT